MLRLEAFGGLRLTDAAGGQIATARRRLALLALLAAAGERGLTRDKLVGFLWAESPGENAKHALEQQLYSLRRQCADDVVLGPDPLRLNPAVVESDVADFQRLLTRGALAEAAALHRGPFLDGFYLSDAPEFERWVETERARLAAEHAGALYRLAREAGSAEHYTLEIAWWRRLASLEPLSERATVGLIHAFVAAGDWTNALRQAHEYEALVRRELATAPVTEMTALVQRLRAERASGGLKRPPAPVPAPAAVDDRYVIEREIGRGTMATVYLAIDRKHARQVALKVLKPELAVSIEAQRFLREIAIVAGLRHPRILPLYDSGTLHQAGQRPTPYYVMPFVQGESLRARLRRQARLLVEDAQVIAREVAEGLGYAHGRGVVHRDVKPENILLEDGHALIADFGIAHAVDASVGDSLSLSGMVLGTPAYMSPEQGAGLRVVDGRSDIYSLGCVLYEMLAGEPPFSGRTAQTVAARHATDPVPPLRTVCPTVPKIVERAVLRALAKRPGDRFATAGEFASALA